MKNLIKNLSLALASLCIAVLLSEIAFVWYEKHFLRGEIVVHNRVVDLAALNYNETQVPIDKPNNEFRILSFGDSFAYTIVKYPFSYHGVAARLLNEALESTRVRIVNLGEPAISFYQYMKAYKHWGSLIEHDAVIFNIYLGNDLLDVAYRFVPDDVEFNYIHGKNRVNLQTGRPREVDVGKQPVRIEQRTIKVPRRYPLRMMDYAYAYYYSVIGKVGNYDLQLMNSSPYSLAVYPLPAEKYYHTSYVTLDNYDPTKVSKLRRGYKALIQFAQMVSSIRQSGKEVLVMLAVPEVEVESELRDALHKRYGVDFATLDLNLPAFLVTQALRHVDKEIAVLKMVDTFRCAARNKQDLYYGTDTHWSVEGNQLAGEVVAQYVFERWLKRYSHKPLVKLQKCVLKRRDLLGDEIPGTEIRESLVNTFLEPLIVSASRGLVK